MCNKDIKINKETNNLHRPVTFKIALFAIVTLIVLIGPHILNVMHPNNEILQIITDGKGWYIYLGIFLIIAAILDFKYFKKEKQ